MSDQLNNQHVRPPVVAIMGHVDHGKSTLLDYIRKSNIVAGEAGGITQHISAYEVVHAAADGTKKKITFIDTPGHAAFSTMRNRGARIADIAILIVSAEDSVKAQTIEAINTIKKAKVPFIVAINKIDKPNANPTKSKQDLMEHEIFVEGFGGDTPVAEISAKTGQGVDDLLELILLAAELEDFKGDPTVPATGFVVESHLDEKRGVSATVIIKNGTLKKKQFVVVNDTMTTTRLMEDFLNENLESATFSSPVTLIGFDTLPEAGSAFETYETKKEAEKAAAAFKELSQTESALFNPFIAGDNQAVIPLIIRTDAAGTQDAVLHEIAKLSNEDVHFKIIKTGIGNVNESDLQLALSDENTIVLGFNVDIDKKARLMNDADSVNVQVFSIIYKLSEWLEEEREKRRIRQKTDEVSGVLKVLKHFSTTKDKHLVGGRVESGSIKVGDTVKLMRRENEIARGTVTNLQQGKSETKQVQADNECGIMVELKHEPAPGDTIEAFETIIK